MRGVPAPRSARKRALSLLAGVSFIVSAIGWLALNDQRRRARVAFLRAMNQSPQPMRAWVGGLWRWWRQWLVDPWAEYRWRVAGGATGAVLEVNVGGWKNLRRYGAVTRLVGVEPLRRNCFAARRRAHRIVPTAEIARSTVERLPFPDATFDTVVASLALCGVRDQDVALAEIRRVLRPGGSLRFLEHVRSRRPAVARFQDIMTPFWRLFVGGCRPNRDTLAAIRRAGLVVGVVDEVVGAPGPARPTVCGIATRPLVEA